jgi:hypothetical protein
MMFRVVFWDILPCKMIVDRRFRGAYCLHHQVDNHFTQQYIPEDNSKHHTRRRENLKSHKRQQTLPRTSCCNIVNGATEVSHSFIIHSQALIVQDGPLASLFGVS